MNKSLFFVAAASALMLTACSSESDVLQSTTQTQQTVVQEAVGFDVYTPAATNVTRAGQEGTMTTPRMQRSEADGGGFGVYAFLTEDETPAAGINDATANATAYTSTAPNVPNFMWNEKVLWNNTSLGWYYNPLKYWPNETDKDSQVTPASMEGTTPVHLDRLTFFAYAPYVAADDASGTGIIRITDKNGVLNTTPSVYNTPDPTIEWKATTSDADFNPDQGVDLLWGVAPAGGLSYTAVNGWTVTRNEGTPFLNMIKPDVNTSMKFLFQHALARFGINVVAAIDQVSPGGVLDPHTKITINSLKISGPFGTTGQLNLNNGVHANIANWTNINGTTVKDGTKITASGSEITLLGDVADDNAIAKNLRWTGPHNAPVTQNVVGITTAKQDLLRPSTKWFNKLASAPTYSFAKQYYTDANGTTPAVAQYKTKTGEYYILEDGHYTVVAANTEINAPVYPKDYIATTYYTVEQVYEYNNVDTYSPAAFPYDTKVYTRTGAGTEVSPYVYTYFGTRADITPWESGEELKKYYTISANKVNVKDIKFAYDPDPANTYYEAERNYLYVVPTNNYIAANTSAPLTDNEKLALRTITVQIEYYITTEDDKLNTLRAQTQNIITKTVVLPSLENGKSYMLNLVLGLTSVKIEAEVDDWKVINVQTDLPQNTAE